MVAFLEKSTGSEGFHQVIDFLTRSHICYALTKKLDVCVSFIKQFKRSAEVTTVDNREVKITATIDGHSMTITEASLQRHLKLDDHDGLSSIPNSEIFEQLALMGYHTDSNNPKKTVWEQFSSNIATAVICQEVALFPTMLIVPEPSTSPSRITSSLSYSPSPSPSPIPSPSPSPSPTPDHTTAAVSQPLPTQPSPTHPSPRAEHHLPTSNESPLYAVHSYGSDDGRLKLNELTDLVTKLFDRIRGQEARGSNQEARVKIGKARKRAKVVLSEDDEDVEDDSFKQGRKLSDAEVQEKANTETKPIIQEVTPTKVIQDQESSEKGSAEVSTAGATKGTASEVPVDKKRQGKSNNDRESEPKKKSKKELEQEKLSFVEAIRLQEQMDEEQRAQIARDEEIARQWDEEERQRVMSEAKNQEREDGGGKEEGEGGRGRGGRRGGWRRRSDGLRRR
ncbi:hypothetical protein Tco_0766316 [Tanacetum coccineum]